MKKFYFLLLGLFLFSGVYAQIVNIPDANFKAKLLSATPSNYIAKNLAGNYIKIDSNSNGQIEASEAMQVGELYVYNSAISSLEGINSFTNLKALNCSTNPLTSLNISSNNLLYLRCESNQLTSSTFQLSNLPNLISLHCFNNPLGSLDLRAQANLVMVDCSSCRLTSLNVSGLNNLDDLDCPYNQLTTLNVSNLPSLLSVDCSHNYLTSINTLGVSSNFRDLQCSYNRLTSLEVNHLTNLTGLFCGTNFLRTLNVSNLTSLTSLWCELNQLTSLFMKNGRNESLSMQGNPNLKYICADESQVSSVESMIYGDGFLYYNCSVSTYCTFVPGGMYYTISGNSKFDATANGCDSNDAYFPNLKFNLSDGTNFGIATSGISGNYSIPVQAGTHVITPVLENPTYFNVSPTSVNVTFPAQASPFNQNFCVTKNGIHNDLEVSVLPIIPARPGFDAKYQIIYKNKGSNTQSGSVNLTFNDAVLDLVSANPTASSQTLNNLSWNFTNLLPLENRLILLTLNVNSPMETPAVNSGYILNYRASITSPVTDEIPNDNIFAYNQTVVNSFDPNDKTCLEGATISPAKVGDYV
ncbi:T9SS C-terminal target domain-containing protein, partial [Flavobacterium sp. GSN2]